MWKEEHWSREARGGAAMMVDRKREKMRDEMVELDGSRSTELTNPRSEFVPVIKD